MTDAPAPAVSRVATTPVPVRAHRAATTGLGHTRAVEEKPSRTA